MGAPFPIPLPDASLLRRIFDYDPKTGELRWEAPLANCVKPGAIAGTWANGYRNVAVHGVKYRAHRIIWKLHYGVDPTGEVDHIDLDKTNNRIANLRDASHGQNQANGRA